MSYVGQSWHWPLYIFDVNTGLAGLSCQRQVIATLMHYSVDRLPKASHCDTVALPVDLFFPESFLLYRLYKLSPSRSFKWLALPPLTIIMLLSPVGCLAVVVQQDQGLTKFNEVFISTCVATLYLAVDMLTLLSAGSQLPLLKISEWQCVCSTFFTRSRNDTHIRPSASDF